MRRTKTVNWYGNKRRKTAHEKDPDFGIGIAKMGSLLVHGTDQERHREVDFPV